VPTGRHLVIAALALVLLPFVLSVIGLGVTSATEVVVFSLACMALNILVGYTGAHVVRSRRLVRPGGVCGRHVAARLVRGLVFLAAGARSCDRRRARRRRSAS
jgi:ABC-type branched-subunit amino acid transport system permease subunit